MPFLKSDDSSIELNRDLEHDVSVALEDENKRALREGGRKMKKVEVDDAYFDHHSPDYTLTSKGIPAVVTPDSRHHKKRLSLPSLHFDSSPVIAKAKLQLRPSQLSDDQEHVSSFPPLLESALEEPHPGDEITFEGEHFHYLDSFVAHSPPQFFSLSPRNECDVVIQQNHSIFPCRPVPVLQSALTTQPSHDVMLSTPLIECNHSESFFSIVQSLREPVMSPYSSSSSSLDEIFRDGGALRIDTDTIFSDDFDGDWEIGKDVGMDAYLP